jgi:ribosomal protein S18 acetylase RimI-like enzyme
MNISVRKGTVSDAPDIARVHVTAWKTTYRGIVPQPFLDSLDVASRTEDWKDWLSREKVHVYVAEDDTELCGFISGGALREPIEGFDAEVYAIYLLSSTKRRGAGRLLMQHLAETLRNSGFTQVALWVLAENPSCGFYEHLGGGRIAQKQIRIGDADLLEIAYGWRDIRTLANSTHDRL